MVTLHDIPRPGRGGAGWLVLIGGTSGRWAATEEIDRAAVARMGRGKPIAFVPAANCPPDYGESFLATYARLGAPDGYEVPIYDRATARDPANAERLREAGLIYFGGGDTTQLLASMTGTHALAAVAAAYEAGAVIVGMSAGAIALAEWGVSLGAGVLEGWGWLPRTVVSVHHTAARDALLARAIEARPQALGVALAEHVALALGPDGEAEQWGGEAIGLVAGAAFDASER